MFPLTFTLSIFTASADPGAPLKPSSAPSLAEPLDWVRQCLNDAPKATAIDDCEGRWSSLCQEQPSGGTTVGITSCIAAELSAWEILLAEVHTKLEVAAREYDQHMPEGVSVQAALAASKTAWDAFRFAQCDYEYTEYADGTMRSIVGAGCRLNLTVQRYEYLLNHGRQQNHFE